MHNFRYIYALVFIVTLVALTLTPGSPEVAANAASEWNQRGTNIDGEAIGDESGIAVASSTDGTIVAIGAHKNQGTGTDAGHVRVYQYSNSSWTQLGSDINGAAAHDFFGSSVSLSGDGTWLAVGAPYYDAGALNDAGHVRVFRYVAGSWVQQGSDIDGEAASDALGSSVAISTDGTTVAIGAPGDAGGGISRGSSRVYEWNSSTTDWDKIGAGAAGDIDGQNNFDSSGAAVALDATGTTIAIGARRNGSSAGQVRVYSTDGSTWSQVGGDIAGEAAGDYLGTSVAISGDGLRVASGAPFNSVGGSATNAGHVRVYSTDGTTWTQVGSDIDGVAGDELGASVSLNDAGTRLVAGGVGANFDTGVARVFDLTGSTWSQLGSDFDGDGASDEFATAAAISGDGTSIVLGAPFHDTTAIDAGQVQIFAYQAITTAAATEDVARPGIYLVVAGPVGRKASGSPVYYGSDRVATTSTYLLTVTPVGDPGARVMILAEGTVGVRGNLEAIATLPRMAPGSYDVAVSGQHLTGIGIQLTSRIKVGKYGRLGAISSNTSSIFG